MSAALLSAREAGDLLGVGPRRVADLAAKGELATAVTLTGSRGKRLFEHNEVMRLAALRSQVDTPEKRYWAKVDRRADDECWPWLAQSMRDGRGRMWWPAHGRLEAAPRIAWLLATGDWPGDLYVCHNCDNPPCVNPTHLFLGSAADNTRDMDRKGRRGKNPVTGLRHPRATTPPEIVRKAVADYLAGMTCFEVGRRYGVADTTVSSWVLAKTRSADAGLTPKRRTLMPCGTRAAAVRHRSRGEAVCDACRIAEAAYTATLKARRLASAA